MLSWRRLGVLVRQLPATARTRRGVLGEAAEWGALEHLLATVIDLLQEANWQRSNVGRKRPTRAPRPITRPGQKRAGSISPERVERLRAMQRRARRRGGDPSPRSS